MGGVIGMEEARALVADRALWPLVRNFLWDFAPQIHPSRTAALLQGGAGAGGGAALPADAAVLAASPHVKAWLLRSLGVETFFHPFPKDDSSRLALLDFATLDSIAKWLGALACADALRGVTSGAEVRALKAALPGIYPDVFGFTAYFRGLSAPAEQAAKTPEGVAALGRSMLFSLFAPLPPQIAARAELKFPEDFRAGEAGSSAPAVPPQALAKLLKLKFPEAYSLCCC